MKVENLYIAYWGMQYDKMGREPSNRRFDKRYFSEGIFTNYSYSSGGGEFGMTNRVVSEKRMRKILFGQVGFKIVFPIGCRLLQTNYIRVDIFYRPSYLWFFSP